LRRLYIIQGHIHPLAVMDPETKRVHAKDELNTSNNKQYWAWVEETFPHMVTLYAHPYDREMHEWIIENVSSLWHMRVSLFRSQMPIEYGKVLPLTNVFFFGNPNDAFHFRIKYGGKVGNHYEVGEIEG
jgi:hypothetical protein